MAPKSYRGISPNRAKEAPSTFLVTKVEANGTAVHLQLKDGVMPSHGEMVALMTIESESQTSPAPRKSSLRALAALRGVEAAKMLGAPLPATLIKELAEELALPVEEAAALIHLRPRTLYQRLKGGELKPHELERIWEIARVFLKAEDLFEGKERARAWLKNPLQALGNQKPIELLRTAAGLRELEAELIRAAHNVYS